MKKLNQNGIAHLAVIAVVAVAAIVTAVGYMVYQNQKSNQASSTTAPVTSTDSEQKVPQEDDKTAVKQAAKQHFKLVYAKKTEEAYKTTCPKFREKTSLETFSTGLEKGNFYTIELTNVDYTTANVANNQARISGEVGPLSPNTTLEVDLLKDDGKWCVLGYRTV